MNGPAVVMQQLPRGMVATKHDIDTALAASSFMDCVRD